MKTFDYDEAKRIIKGLCDAAEAEEFDTREKFEEALEKHPYVAVQGYNPYGKIFYWNGPSAHVYGYTIDEAVNQDLFELILPPDMQQFARDLVFAAQKNGRMPEAAPCDLVHRNGEFVTVYSGHVVFNWDNAATPEFYCLDLPLNTEVEETQEFQTQPPNPLTT